jgi:hypothetical protein
MSCFAFAVGTITPGAGTADGSVLTTGTYMALVGGSANQMSFVDEVYMGGQAASTAPLIMLLRHDSTLGATPTTLVTPNSNGPTNINAGVLTNPAVGFVAATTQPTPSNSITVAKKNFTFNAFGGIVRANYANTQDRYAIFGNATTTNSELSLSSFTGSTAGAAVGAHIIYETL